MSVCPGCGSEAGGGKFCSHCGAPIQPASPVTPSVPPLPVVPAAVPHGKRTLLWVVIALLVLAAAATGAVLAVVLPDEETVKVTFENPGPDETITEASLKVNVKVQAAEKVNTVSIYVDDAIKESIESAPFEAEIPSGRAGLHELKAAAYDANGKLLAEDLVEYEKKGQKGTDLEEEKVEQYRFDATNWINEAGSLDSAIKTNAEAINSELSKGYVALAEVRQVYERASLLLDAVQKFEPPAGMLDIQSQFQPVAGYLKTRADALLSGGEAVNAGRSYTADFNRGAAAKSKFDAAWPVFLNACRAKGFNI